MTKIYNFKLNAKISAVFILFPWTKDFVIKLFFPKEV